MRPNWISVLRPAARGPLRRVLVVPHAGAGPNALAPLWECLPADVEVTGVTLPGRERRFAEDPATIPDDPDTVVDAVLSEMARLSFVPTVPFGHSLGAGIAAALVDAEPAWFESVVVSAYPAEGTAADRAGEWSDDRLLAILSGAGGTPMQVVGSQAWRGHLLELLRRDLTLGARLAHRTVGPLGVPTTVLHGADDPLIPAPDASLWAARTAAGLRTLTLPGGHFYLLDEPNLITVADEIVATFQDRAVAA